MTFAKALKAADKSPSHKVAEPWRIRRGLWHPAVHLVITPTSYGLYSCYMRIAPAKEYLGELAMYVPGDYRLSVADALSNDWEVYEP